tara:strand:- start:1200 stop:1325 length:126 start_codon:yes stop_codon:yes gene_type:complete
MEKNMEITVREERRIKERKEFKIFVSILTSYISIFFIVYFK